MKRREAIALTSGEREEFLRRAKTIILSTLDRHGYPHSVPMWYIVQQDGSVLMTTYAKSQKVLNIRRNPKVALLVESGETYDVLKGVVIRGQAEVVEDFEVRLSVISSVHRKMTGSLPAGVEQALRQQAAKRVVIKVSPQHISSWDHSKLGGTY
jgi:PPOX class probable F420-dependent enzyme